MIYIYNCYGGTHSSPIAASYHLGKLPEDCLPTKNEILSTYLFNRLTYSDMGRIFYHGKDEHGNLIYSLARGRCKHLVPALKELVNLIHTNHPTNPRIVFSNTSPTVPFVMTMGGFLARGLKMDPVGVPLLIKGVHQSYSDIRRLVQHTKKVGRSMQEEVLILENKEFK